MKAFEVKFLSPKEMAGAKNMDGRYEFVDEDNLGFADASKNRLFIRAGLDKELTKYLISHEYEHLLEEKGTHEDSNGIRHKKGNFWANSFDPLGVFHEGNMLGIGHDQGKAGLGEVIKPFAGDIGALLGTAFGGPGGGALGGAIGGGLGSLMPSGKKASFQGDSFSNMFGGGGISQQNQMSLGQGFGQTGSFSPGGMGSQGGQSAPMANMGLGAGLPNQANISMGQGAQGNRDQRQSGFWFPQFRF